jgi:hypothetical protein
MSERDSEAELISVGLAEYPSARAALETFEHAIQQIAKDAILEQIAEFKPAVGHTDPADPWLGEVDAAGIFSGHLGVGAQVNAPGTWGLRLGLRWPSGGKLDSMRPVACLCVRVSAGYKKEKLFRALVGGATADVQIENLSSYPHEVAFTRTQPADATPEAIRDAFDLLLSTFIRIVSKSGGLQGLIT